MIQYCNVCSKKILRHSYQLKCSSCSCLVHLKCLPSVKRDDPLYTERHQNTWFCTKCIDSTLPFANIIDDDEFISTINSNQFYFVKQCIKDLNSNNFMLEDPPDIDPNDLLNENDPDVHFYGADSNLYTPSNFYNADTLEHKLKELTFEHHKGFSLLHHNIRSIPSNLSKLTSYLALLHLKPTIIGISETWLTSDNKDRYFIPEYSSVHLCRPKKRGGGVSLFIKNGINFKYRSDLEYSTPDIECIFIEIDKNELGSEKNILIGITYRPPGRDILAFNEILNDQLDQIKKSNTYNYLLGDFNINLLSSNNHPPTAQFVDSMYANFHLPLINKPTRVAEHSMTLIDNIFFNGSSKLDTFAGILFTDISDHFPIFCVSNIIKHENPSDEYFYKRSYCPMNMTKFQNNLNNLEWSTIINDTDPQSSFTAFHNTLSTIHNKAFPLKRIKKGYINRKPWLSSAFKNSIRTKNVLFYKSKINPSLRTTYTTYRNRLNSLLHKAEREHIKQLLDNHKNNLARSWQIIKDVININRSNSTLPKEFLINNRLVSNNQLIADSFNEFYINLGASLSSKNTCNDSPMKYMNNPNNKSIFLFPTDESEVKSILIDLKPNSSGWDDLPGRIFRDNSGALMKPLIHVINLSLSKGVFPSELKIAKVIPLFKGNEKNLLKNYRPISLLPVLSKIFEKIMYKRLSSFIDINQLLYKLQFGFRKKHSTNTALIILMDKITSELEKGNFVLGVFLDYSKAFDCVNHAILLQKLHYYGIRGIALEWFRSYLSSRKQFVMFNGIKSVYKDVQCGVPQGSVLGPILFLLYINDIVNVSDVLFPILFADDSNVFISGNNIDTIIQSMNAELEKLMVWLSINKLSLNIGKTNYMIFSPPRKKPLATNPVIIRGTEIKQISETKFLGVVVDDKLSWKNHINYISRKISRGIGIILKARKFLPKSYLLSLYSSFIYPYYDYCIEVWGKASNIVLSKLIKLQKKAIRIISFKPSRDPTEPLFNSLEILPLNKIYLYKVGIYMFKLNNNLLPEICIDMFTKNSNIHNYSTRTRNCFHIPKIKTNLCKNSIRFQGAIVGNLFMKNINSNCTIPTYKYRVKNFLRNTILIGL